MASQYYLFRKDRETGPFGFRELVAFVREGMLADSDLVRFSYRTDWQRADSLVGLFYMARRSDPAQVEPQSICTEAAEQIQHDLNEEVIVPASDDRPGWMRRLLQVGGFRRKKTPEIPIQDLPVVELPHSTVACAGDASTDSESSIFSNSGSLIGVLPAELAEFLQDDGSAGSSRWSIAVDAALESADRSHARQCEILGAGRLRRMLGRLAQFVSRGDERQFLVLNGFRIVSVIVCANLVAWGIENWSVQEALRFPSRDVRVTNLHYFPLIGGCDNMEYTILLLHLALAGGVGAWCGVGWLASRAE